MLASLLHTAVTVHCVPCLVKEILFYDSGSDIIKLNSQYLMKSCKNLKGGLQEVAEQLELERVGPQHQAGSDSLLTGAAFFKMKEVGGIHL